MATVKKKPARKAAPKKSGLKKLVVKKVAKKPVAKKATKKTPSSSPVVSKRFAHIVISGARDFYRYEIRNPSGKTQACSVWYMKKHSAITAAERLNKLLGGALRIVDKT